MKYFTNEWCFSRLDDDQIELAITRYNTYINQIYQTLPFVLKIMAKQINFHDGILSYACYAQDQNILILKGIFGDLQIGYFFLEIKYIDTINLKPDLLNSIFDKQLIEILSDEISKDSEGIYAHKMLFSTNSEIDIQFKDVQISIQNANPKEYKKNQCELKFI